jgi:hypothetical protein
MGLGLTVKHDVLRVTRADECEEYDEEEDHHRDPAHYIEPRTESAVDSRTVLVEIVVLLSLFLGHVLPLYTVHTLGTLDCGHF